jgi:hypothetical protein
MAYFGDCGRYVPACALLPEGITQRRQLLGRLADQCLADIGIESEVHGRLTVGEAGADEIRRAALVPRSSRALSS